MCPLLVLADLQAGGDNLVDTISEGLQEQSRSKVTNEPRRFIEMDSHEAVKIGDQDLPELGHPQRGGPVDTS